MKTRIIILSLLMTLCSIFSACENEAVDITTTVDITVNTSSVVKPFIVNKQSDLEMFSHPNQGLSRVRLTCLLYDQNGKLSNRQDIALNDFSAATTIQEKLTDQTYTLVIVASCVLGGSLTKPDYEAYSMSGIDYLNTLKIEQNFFISYASCWSILGFEKMEITQNNYESVINLSPATAFVYYYWKDIHNNSKIDSYRLLWAANNRMTFVQGNVDYSISDVDVFLEGDEIIPDDISTSTPNIYNIINVLPGALDVRGGSYIGTSRINSIDKSATVLAGHQYVICYDCSADSLTIREGKL